jgi:ubiquinone/menaquinone biosynthesis C-methylase UbiE
LKKEVKYFKDKKILEAGCGSGRISLRCAQHGADVYLLDVCQEAVKVAKKAFTKNKETLNIIQASIFNIPFKDNYFDVVWNAGVLEHFLEYEQIHALEEMKRVCKNRGLIITMVPCSKAIFYRIGKFYQEKTRKWKWGYEKPIKTLNRLYKKSLIRLEREFSVGFEEQLQFILSIPHMGYLVLLLRKIERLFSLLGLGGYLLVSIGVKCGNNKVLRMT